MGRGKRSADVPRGSLVSSVLVLVIWPTATASSSTRFKNSSKPYLAVSGHPLLLVRPWGLRQALTLILPSIRIESCSYSHTLTVACYGARVSRGSYT